MGQARQKANVQTSFRFSAETYRTLQEASQRTGIPMKVILERLILTHVPNLANTLPAR